MERPAWTIGFVLIWLLVLPGAIMTHMGVGSLSGPLKDLPKNIVKGFDEVFRFNYMEQDVVKIKNACSTAIKLCPNTLATTELTCALGNTYGAGSTTSSCTKSNGLCAMNTTESLATIQTAFVNSLAVVNRVANDKYFGTNELAATAASLNEIMAEMAKIPADMPCGETGTPGAVQSFCEIYSNAGRILDGMSEVTKAIDAFEKNDAVKVWDDYSDFLTFLHLLPYIMVIALIFFSLFWLKGGICCCCKQGSLCGSLALFPFAIFWLVTFIIYAVILAIGYTIKVLSKDIEVDGLKGKPSLKEAIEHIKDKFPLFWKTVFADMEDPCLHLYNSAWFFTIAALLILVYSLCTCCCRPYQKTEAAENAAV